ncbi:Sas10/Utp3/C1D family-domain-containing protein [Elsinoe ampelina]|uniref:Exosome complex protein n=1 Tax=Elsinoe ampelina TaxID=302913 RepID=A0A6A6G3Y1_9PEZI|nr:Sas10/Utp3/C1D family-domain-containing protein [Elsinoe ampelina]
MAADTDSSHISTLLNNLSSHVDTTSQALQPLLSKPLSSTASKLPLLDKAKLYIHVAYAIESLLFSQFQLSGVEAKSHPIFAELKRVRSYFEKIKHAEGQGGPSMKLDKGAAGRMIKAGLAGNDRKDREDAQDQQGIKRKAQEQELVERYSKGNRFGAAGKRMKEDEAEGREEMIEGEGGERDETTRQASSKKSRAEKSGTKENRSASDKHSRRTKHSHAPNDAHGAFQKLLGKSKDSTGESGKKKKHKG